MRSVVWPRIGVTAVVDEPELPARPGDVVVDVTVSVVSPGTERARLLGLPTARVAFPHNPGYLAAGRAHGGAGIAHGTPVAVRGAGHRSVVVTPAHQVRAVPGHVPPGDAAVWQLALTALHGIALSGHRPGDPVTVVGAGLLGVITRRLLAARGAPAVTAVAASDAKAWATRTEPVTTFVTADRARAGTAVTFDVTGSADGLDTSVAATSDGGRIVLLGSPRADPAPAPLQRMYDRGLELVGAHAATLADADEPALSGAFFDLLDGGRFTVGDVLAEYPAHEAPEVYRRLVADRSLVGAALIWRPRRRSVPARAGRPAAGPVRFGLVGCGDIGIKDAQAVAAAGARLVACHDPLAQLAADVAGRFRATAEPDLASLLARDDIDAVVVATPHDTHEPVALAALAAGRHVLLEKPLAHTLASGRRIAAAAAEAALTTGVLFPMRADPRFLRARAALDQGLVGAPLGVSAAYLVNKPEAYFDGGYSQRARSTWRRSKARAGGGFVIMNLVHQIDVIRALLGVEADRVYAEAAAAASAPEIEDVVTVVVRFGATIATLVGCGSVPGGGRQQLRLWGASGQVQVLPEFLLTARQPVPFPAPDSVPGDPRALAIAHFAAAVRDGTPAQATVTDAVAVQAIVEAAYESVRLCRPVCPADLAGGGTG